MQRRRFRIMFIILASLLGALVWWYWPDPYLVRTIVMGDRVSAVAFSPDGKTLAVGVAHGTIELRAIATGELVRQLSGHTGNVLSLAWSADGQQLVSGAYDGTVRLWSLSEPFTKTILIQKPPIASVIHTDEDGNERSLQVSFYSVAFSADAYMVAAGSDEGRAYLVDTTGKSERHIQVGADDGFTNRVSALAFHSSGSRIAFAATDRLLIVQIDRTGAVTEQVAFVKGYANAIYSLQFHDQDHTLRSFDSSGTFSAWSLTTSRAVTEVDVNYPDPINARMLTASSGTLSRDGQLIAFGGGITRPMFRGLPILGAHDGRVLVARTGEATPWLTLKGHSDYVNGVAFSPDAKLLASGSSDRTVRLWSVTS